MNLLKFTSFHNFDKRSSVFSQNVHAYLQLVLNDMLYDSDPQSAIIGRPGGVLLSANVLTGLWILESR